LLEEISSALLAQTDPSTGRRVVEGVYRKEEIYAGPALDLAPDLIVDTWSAGYRVAPGREASEEMVVPAAPLAGVQSSWSSDHRPVGILVGAGPRFASGRGEADLYDVAPTTLALLEQGIPEGLDGRVLTPALDEGFLAAHPVRTLDAVESRTGEGTYSEEEAAAVAAHLKDLGYIE
jgi:predicted AlkP superfamily phosphohydrolase/phosphomutase